MIKFPGSPPRMGPLCLPDGWPTGLFLPSALPSRAHGGGVGWGGGFPGAQRTLLCAPLCLPLSPRALSPPEPSLGRASHSAELQGVEGSEWFLP